VAKVYYNTNTEKKL